MPDLKPFNYIKDVFGIEEVITSNIEQIIENTSTSCHNELEKLDEFEATVAGCTLCKLSLRRKNIVFGEGDHNAKLMFVGEGPGYEEDKQGIPFVGKAGQLLTKMIIAMGLKREEVYISNIVKCRPPENRNPFKEEINSCMPYLMRQIEIIKPEIIICLGSVATVSLLNTTQPISKIRGKFINFKNIKVMPTFHPAYLLRNEKMKKPAWQDLQEVMKEMGLVKK